ncbi:MAG: cytochrome c-type bioproteinis protein CcmE [bacterium]|nr:MAG: cytochrome c-type bioproteinis protein CcmE [bacterium]
MEKRRRLKPILISIVIVSIIGYLIYTGLRDTMTYYLTVSEVVAKSSEIQDKTIRIGGNVSPDSVQWDSKDLRLVFKIEDNKSSLNVDYRGVVPDSFKPGREVVVEGTYKGNGQFMATTIMPKCASKYE